MYDIIIIGGGPAGLTAAIYALRADKSVLLLEKAWLGGQIIYSEKIENFPGIAQISGLDFVNTLKQQVKNLGGEIRYELANAIKNEKTKTVITDKAEYLAKSIIIATGVKNRRLNVEGEERLIGKGISFCAVCDGAFYRERTVAVIGGGNTAVQDALMLAAIAKKVYLIHRRDKFRAENQLVKKLEEYKNLEILFNYEVKEFCGDSRLSGIDLVSVKAEEGLHINVDGAFIAIGQIPQNDSFKELVTHTDSGYVLAGEDCTTNISGVFAAGDCRTKTVRQLTTAVGDGSVAALAAVEYIDEIFL
jgi:thioredoxin reductase (NADPH)